MVTVVPPIVFVPLGDYGLEALTGFNKIESWRGSVFYHSLFGNRIKVLPTVHPAYLFQMPTLRSASKSDFARIAREAVQSQKCIEYCDNTLLGATASDLLAMLNVLSGRKQLISLDVETSYAKPFEAVLKTVGIAWAKDAGMNVEWEMLGPDEKAGILFHRKGLSKNT